MTSGPFKAEDFEGSHDFKVIRAGISRELSFVVAQIANAKIAELARCENSKGGHFVSTFTDRGYPVCSYCGLPLSLVAVVGE
jgi:hypothetical protein